MKIIVQTLLFASTLLAVQTSVHCDEDAFSQSKTASAAADSVRSAVTETGSALLKSESSSEPLNSESSNRNTQTYNSLYSGGGRLQDSQDYNGGPRAQILSQPPLTIYRPVDITNIPYDDQSQQGYTQQEQQEGHEQYVPQGYAQSPAQDVRQSGEDASYGQSQPRPTGYSSTYSSPDVKVVSHTRTIMPIVYSGNQRIKPLEENEEERVAGGYGVVSTAQDEQQQHQQQQPILQHELTYSQEAPGLSYDKSQQSYSSPSASSQNPDPRYASGYGVAFQTANQLPSSYAEQKYSSAPEVKESYTPLQPIQAHVQVIEDDAPKAYGERTQKLSVDHGQQPPRSYYPPSPSLASLLEQTYGAQQQQQDGNNYRQQPSQLQQNSYAVYQQQQQQQQQPQQQLSYSKDLAQSYSQADDSDPDNKANAPNNYEYTIGDIRNYDVQQQVPQVSAYNTQQQPIPQVQYVTKTVPTIVDFNKNTNYATSGLVNSDSDTASYGGESYKEVSNSDNSNNNNNNVGKQSYSQVAARPVTLGAQRQSPRLYKLGPDIEYGFIPLSLANLRDLGGYGPQGYDNSKAKPSNYGSDDVRGKPDVSSAYGKERGNDDDRRNSLLHFPNDDEDSGDGIGKLLANVAHKTSNYKGPVDQSYSAGGAKPYKPPIGSNGRPGFGGVRGPYQKKAFEKPKIAGYNKNFGPLYNDEDKDLLFDSDSDYGSPKLSGARKRVRGYPRGIGSGSSDLPPGASYDPRDVGLDESVIAQLNMDDNPYGRYASASSFDLLSNADTGLLASYGPKPRKPVPYSMSGQGFRSQYGYAAASELSPIHSPSPNNNDSSNNPNNPVMNILGNFKGLRSLVSYLTGGITG